MSSRAEKIEARKRGALSRQISSSQLVLGSPKTPMKPGRNSKPTTPRNLTQLESVFNDDFETKSRGSTPRYKNISTTPRNLNILQSAFNAGVHLSGRRQTKSPRPTYIPPERTTPRRTSIHHQGKENVSPIASNSSIEFNASQKIAKKNVLGADKKRIAILPKRKSITSKTPKSTTKRNSIVKATPKRKSTVEVTPKIRKSKRKHKPLPKNDSDIEEEPDISDFDSDYHSDHNEPSVAPTPISKPKSKPKSKSRPSPKLKSKKLHKIAVKSKMIEVKLERLSYTPKGSHPKNISSLDVLSQIMREYLSASQPTTSSQLDRKALKNYSALIGDHFTRLIDNTLNNESLSKELVNSNKRKEQLRNQIYEVRKKHDELLLNLENLRKLYQLRKKKYESNLKVENSLKKLKGENVDEEGMLNGENGSSLDKVWMNVIKLDKVTNLKMGILNKFEKLNETLTKIDAEV